MSFFFKIQVCISTLLAVKGRPALNKLYRLVSQTQFFRSSGTGSRGLRSPHSKANMARGGSLSLGFLNFSFSFCKALRTSTGSVLPVNFCTPSSLNKDNKTETITLIQAEKLGQTYERRRKGLYSNSSIRVEGTVGLSSSSLACGCNSLQLCQINKPGLQHEGFTQSNIRYSISASWICGFKHFSEYFLTLAQLSISLTVSFSGSTSMANFRFFMVYSCPQNTFCKWR